MKINKPIFIEKVATCFFNKGKVELYTFSVKQLKR